ncbi:MAG: trypsin-like peptidase domain-containing protein [Candidatus Zixiibacteriota bacterium]
MKDQLIPPDRHNPRRFGVATVFTVALLSVVIGIVVASRFDLPHPAEAQVPTNIAQTGLYPIVDRNGEQESPFVGVVDRVKDAVVNVAAVTEDEQLPWWYHGGGFGTSSGSGFFFREDGYILTNSHVVRGSRQVTVRTSSGYEYDAKVVGIDTATDLAVLKVDPQEKVTTIPFGDSEGIKVGDWAIAIGNPFPQQGLDRTVTVGVISAKGRSNLRFGDETPLFQNYIQTDASINPGNSGGPLLNLRGECVGVNSAISSPTGSSVGIGFAIPINLARAVVPDLIASGKVSRGWLGVWLSNVTERQAKRLGLKAVQGVVIDSVFYGSPAEQAGIRRGDVVVAFNNEEVQNSNQFAVLVSTVKSGASVPVQVIREGNEMTLTATVADRDASLASASVGRGGRDQMALDWMGMELVSFTEDMARQIGIKPIAGLYVNRVYSGSAADRASIAEGTIITQVSGAEVGSIGDIKRLETRIGKGARVPLIVLEPDGTIARKVLRP